VYKVKINLAKYLTYIFFSLCGFTVILEILAFSFSSIPAISLSDLLFGQNTPAKKALIFGVVACIWFPLFFGLIFTAFGAFVLSSLKCTLTPEGVEYSPTLFVRNKILWKEIDDIHDQWGYYILRKKLPEGFSTEMEQANPTLWGSKICRIPKAFLVKDLESFLSYLNQVLPAGSAIRACYFPN
jgi:hypothetical protein